MPGTATPSARIQVDEAALDAAIAEGRFSGVVAVDVASERVLERAEGWMHRGFRVPMRPDARIAVASGSKLLTALAVLRLVEEGVLRLDQPVRGLLGDDLPLIDDAVTIEHLLGHTSGIGDYLDEEGDWSPADFPLTVPPHALTTAAAFLPLLDGFPQQREPGTAFSYCNGGYAVLAIVLERVAGEPFQAVVRRLVLEPAGLAATDHLRLDALPGDAARPYVFDEGDEEAVLRLPVQGSGDGGAFTTAADLHRLWLALLDGRIVRPETVALMTAPRHEVPGEGKRAGLGVFLHGEHDGLIVEGWDAGASFRSTHLVASRTTVSVLGSTSDGGWPVIAALEPAIDAALAAGA